MENRNALISEDKNENGNSGVPDTQSACRSGGLYAKVNMSVKSANIMVAVLTAVLVIAAVFIINHSGFTVKFDTNGGSHMDSVKVMHSELVTVSQDPVKEGFVFSGWYTDRDCTNKWDIENDPVSGSMTLYAGWQAKQ